MDYLRYYFLENYLFDEVRSNFNKRGYLTPEEFFCIVIWKTDRSKTKIRDSILKIKIGRNLEEKIREITKAIHEAKTGDKNGTKRLKTLLNNKNWKFYLPTASAILTVLYPNEFSVYDFRVRGQLGIKKEISGYKRYFGEFLPNVILTARKVSGLKNLSLRDADRILWGKSFYEDIVKFIG